MISGLTEWQSIIRSMPAVCPSTNILLIRYENLVVDQDLQDRHTLVALCFPSREHEFDPRRPLQKTILCRRPDESLLLEPSNLQSVALQGIDC